MRSLECRAWGERERNERTSDLLCDAAPLGRRAVDHQQRSTRTRTPRGRHPRHPARHPRRSPTADPQHQHTGCRGQSLQGGPRRRRRAGRAPRGEAKVRLSCPRPEAEGRYVSWLHPRRFAAPTAPAPSSSLESLTASPPSSPAVQTTSGTASTPQGSTPSGPTRGIVS